MHDTGRATRGRLAPVAMALAVAAVRGHLSIRLSSPTADGNAVLTIQRSRAPSLSAVSDRGYARPVGRRPRADSSRSE